MIKLINNCIICQKELNYTNSEVICDSEEHFAYYTLDQIDASENIYTRAIVIQEKSYTIIIKFLTEEIKINCSKPFQINFDESLIFNYNKLTDKINKLLNFI